MRDVGSPSTHYSPLSPCSLQLCRCTDNGQLKLTPLPLPLYSWPPWQRIRCNYNRRQCRPRPTHCLPHKTMRLPSTVIANPLPLPLPHHLANLATAMALNKTSAASSAAVAAAASPSTFGSARKTNGAAIFHFQQLPQQQEQQQQQLRQLMTML